MKTLRANQISGFCQRGAAKSEGSPNASELHQNITKYLAQNVPYNKSPELIISPDFNLFHFKGETFHLVQGPNATAINSTSVTVWYTHPVIPKEDQFTLSNIKLVYNKIGSPELSVVLNSSKSMHILSGLNKYTIYELKLQYIGNIYAIETSTTTQRTDEDGK